MVLGATAGVGAVWEEGYGVDIERGHDEWKRLQCGLSQDIGSAASGNVLG